MPRNKPILWQRLVFFGGSQKGVSPASRDEVLHRLADVGIPSRPYFTPIYLQPFYRRRFGYAEGDYPVTEELGRTCLALPFSSVMTVDGVDMVCDRLRRTLGSRRP